MHSVMGVMTALVVSAVGTGDETTSSNTVPELEQRRTFVGLAVPLSPSGLAVEGERALNERFSVNPLNVSKDSFRRLSPFGFVCHRAHRLRRGSARRRPADRL